LNRHRRERRWRALLTAGVVLMLLAALGMTAIAAAVEAGTR
jgi:hypothetical protein